MIQFVAVCGITAGLAEHMWQKQKACGQVGELCAGAVSQMPLLVHAYLCGHASLAGYCLQKQLCLDWTWLQVYCLIWADNLLSVQSQTCKVVNPPDLPLSVEVCVDACFSNGSVALSAMGVMYQKLGLVMYQLMEPVRVVQHHHPFHWQEGMVEVVLGGY